MFVLKINKARILVSLGIPRWHCSIPVHDLFLSSKFLNHPCDSLASPGVLECLILPSGSGRVCSLWKLGFIYEASLTLFHFEEPSSEQARCRGLSVGALFPPQLYFTGHPCPSSAKHLLAFTLLLQLVSWCLSQCSFRAKGNPTSKCKSPHIPHGLFPKSLLVSPTSCSAAIATPPNFSCPVCIVWSLSVFHTVLSHHGN